MRPRGKFVFVSFLAQNGKLLQQTALFGRLSDQAGLRLRGSFVQRFSQGKGELSYGIQFKALIFVAENSEAGLAWHKKLF